MKLDFKDVVNTIHTARERKDYDKDTKGLLRNIAIFSAFWGTVIGINSGLGLAGAVVSVAKVAALVTFVVPPVAITAVIAAGMTYAAVKNFKQFKKDAKELMPKILSAPFVFPVAAAKSIAGMTGDLFKSAKKFFAGKKEKPEAQAPEAIDAPSALANAQATADFKNAATPDASVTVKAAPQQKPDAPKP